MHLNVFARTFLRVQQFHLFLHLLTKIYVRRLSACTPFTFAHLLLRLCRAFAGSGYRMRVLDKKILNTRLVENFGGKASKLTAEDKLQLGDLTFAEVSSNDSMVLRFPMNSGIYTRALSFRSRLHIRWCKQAGMDVDLDPKAVTYGSPGKYKEIVEAWFQRNDGRWYK